MVGLLNQGVTAKKLATGIACGIVLGVFPLPGSTTLLCTLVAVTLGLNLPAIQLANYAVYPLQLLLLLPFFQLGDLLFQVEPGGFPASQLIALLPSDPWAAIGGLSDPTLRAMVAWLVMVPPVFLALRLLLLHLIKGWGRQHKDGEGLPSL